MTIVCVSKWNAQIIKQSFMANYQIKIINNGIDTGIFKPNNGLNTLKSNDLLGKFIVLGVANTWTERKGLNDFIELSKTLHDDVRIVLVGISMKIAKRLPNIITAIEKTESIDELADLYASADVFVNPTWEDNFPTTNIESLACGTPVITYDTGGSPESIDSNTGLVVDKGDISGLQKAIDDIRATGKAEYSLACRAAAQKMYTNQDRYREYFDLYNSILQNQNS